MVAILVLDAAFRKVWIVHERTQNAVLFLSFLGVIGALTLSAMAIVVRSSAATAGRSWRLRAGDVVVREGQRDATRSMTPVEQLRDTTPTSK